MKITKMLYPVLIATLIASLVLSACGATDTPTAAVPTAAPTAEPTVEPTAVPPTVEAAGEADMTDDGQGAMAGAFPEELAAQLDAFLQSQVYSEGGYPKGAAPGLVLLVDTPEGRYLNAAGVNSIEDGSPMQVDDRLEIGSNSKSFLVVVLMQ